MSFSFKIPSCLSSLPQDLWDIESYKKPSFKEEATLKENAEFSLGRRLRPQMAVFSKRKKVEDGSNSLRALSGKSTFLEGLNPRLIKGSVLGEMLENEDDDCEIFRGICERVHSTACQQLLGIMRLTTEEALKIELAAKLTSIAQKGSKIDFEEVSKLTREAIAEVDLKKESSLDEMKEYINSISPGQLQIVIEVLNLLIEALKDESKVSLLIDFCLNEYDILFPESVDAHTDLLKFQILFEIFEYLKLDSFQREHFEPFNEKFPAYPLPKWPRSIKQLNLDREASKEIDVSRFSKLEGIELSRCNREYTSCNGDAFVQSFFDEIMNKEFITSIKFTSMNVGGLDFTKFNNLKKIVFVEVYQNGFTAFDKLNKMSLEDLEIIDTDCTGMKFSNLTNLRKLSISAKRGSICCSTSLFSDQFSSDGNNFMLNKLSLKYVDVNDLDFLNLTNLTELELLSVNRLKSGSFNTIPNQGVIERLSITDLDVSYLFFTGFTNLSYLDLSSSIVTVEKFSTIPSKGLITTLKLKDVCVKYFDFSTFISLEHLDIFKSTGLTALQFNSLPNKNLIVTLDLQSVNIAGFDFSRFKNLKFLYLGASRGITAEQFNAIPQEAKASVETLCLSFLNIKDFDLSGFTNLKELKLSNVKGVTKRQFDAIPNRNFIKKSDI
jgi:hypothetical protein